MFSRRSLALGIAATGSLVAAQGPCDLYSSGGTPCVAAHSTTRALFAAYNGPLYQVLRNSDGATVDIAPLAAGGVANAATQDSFCAGTTCVITKIYDQANRGNHLTQAPGGGLTGPEANGYDNLASAIGAPVTLNGQKAYGVFVSPGTGYRNNAPSGTATGDGAEGIYAVVDGTHFNDGCCFDYGNGELNTHDTGNGHMEALYFGTSVGWASGAGNGPWIQADLENGLFAGAASGVNPGSPTITSRFVTAILKGQANNWSLRGGNAASGQLQTYYAGTRPNENGYNPMSKEGAIILGVGGDNSPWSQGTFYEGVMTSGYPTDATENAVQANIVAAKYATTSMTSGPALPAIGSSISLRATTACCTTEYITHSGSTISIQQVSSSSSAALKGQASWIVRAGLGNSACFSFESKDTPGNFMRHSNFQLVLNANDGSKLFGEDATYCPQAGLNGQGNSFHSWSYPTHWFRHYNSIVYVASNGGVSGFDATYSFNDDVSFVVSAGFA